MSYRSSWLRSPRSVRTGSKSRTILCLAGLTCLMAGTASAVLPPWLQHVTGASAAESALYRLMKLPFVEALYPRPPAEAQRELDRVISSGHDAGPGNAELYQLRARTDEQALDETAAERDWKLYAAKAKDPVAARLELANYYHRRMLAPQEIAALSEVAAAPAPPDETYVDPLQQRSWRAFDRLIALASDQALPPAQTASILDAFLRRYPEEPAVYALALKFQLGQKDFSAAAAVVSRYRTQFPQDSVFPTRAEALIAFRRGDAAAALAVYDRAFQPLWPPELIQSYFSLLEQTHRQRAFTAEQRARLAAHPDGPEAMKALAGIFYYDQQAGRLDAAQRTLDAFRIARESRKAAWTPSDLDTLASLTSATHAYAESARYHYALASTEGTLPSGEPAAQAGLAGLVHILLEAPDQPLALGSQNLLLYRDIATLDQGPGYWNGILSLWLNGTSPQREYNDEAGKAQAYFHRSKAAELLADLDRRFPTAPKRPALHAELIQAIAQYGEPAAIIAEGRAFLAAFPNAPQRLTVAGLVADAYARLNDTANEFALYDAQLAELAARTNGLPLTAAAASLEQAAGNDAAISITLRDPGGTFTDAASTNPIANDVDPANASQATQPSLPPLASRPVRRSLPEAVDYTRILDRYLGRLTSTGNLPRALTVLRTQLDRNPNDPLLYERMATFLDQNNLSAGQEKVFEQAIAHFQQPTWYDKLARVYLREKKSQDFATLTRQVTDIFSGTDLDAYFRNVNSGQPVGPQLALELNLYAAKRFPHDLVFTRNLLAAWQARPTRNSHAYDLLIRSHWWESPDLENEFLEYLSHTGKLQAELDSLASLASDSSDPAATHELAALDIFTSHFEQAAPLLGSVADLYPADAGTGDQAVSLFGSLAYLDPTEAATKRAAVLETRLLNAAPDSPERLATLGDLYAEATSTGGENLAAANPYFRRIPALHPGSTQGYLASATIFWDYFQFDDALAQLNAARTRFHSASLFAYEAGAIEESRSNQPAAVAEYINAVLHPLENPLKLDSASGVLDAFFKPPSDAADSSLWASAQSFVGTPEAGGRLLVLARRSATRSLVDSATAKGFTENPTNSAALTLRADVITAQHHAPELNPLLTTLFDDALAHASTFDQAEAVGSLAQSRNLVPVYERALAKQASLTLDPVQKIELEYSLVRSLDPRKDTASAAHLVDSIYQANPTILGLIRATTDFYARNAQPQKAIAVLLNAAKAATPDLARDFTLEAANRANEADDFVQARALATGLLVQTPYDARVLNLIATSYAHAHDDAGLHSFYLARLEAARTDPTLTVEARRQNIALLRRGLIPALTRTNDFAGAVDQYIALLSAFPGDSGTAQEAALYALKHQRQAQLLNFLQTTVKQSPQDSRFAILLAQTETTFGDLSAAESAYSQAIAVRKDRADLYSARVDLELRLSQTDPAQAELAAADLEKLYLLSYHDPSWMLRLAELRARQQRPAQAVQALETAYIIGHTRAASDFFTVAAQLERWNLLAEARTFADQGVQLAGPDLLAPPMTPSYGDRPDSGAVVYARILTRLGKADEALATLTAARRAAQLSANSPAAVAAELARENITGDEEKNFRASFAANRLRTVDAALEAAVNAMGAAVAAFYTPEQKLAYAQALDRLHDKSQPGANPELALKAAASAGLADREAAWRKQLLLDEPLTRADASELQAYTSLQQRRLAFKDLARTLEAYSARVPHAQRDGIRQQAAQAWRDSGDPADEMRVERSIVLDNDSALRDRFFDLLLRRDPTALIAFAGDRNGSLADAAVNYAIAHADRPQALAVVARRSQNLPPVWRPASASLVETYFATPQSRAGNISDFTQSLASESTIAARLAARPDPAQQLTGDTFFFYASRFGIFLATVPKTPTLPDPEDFLPAQLEATPTLPAPYLDLARTYAEAGNLASALNEYNHVLELAPSDSSAPAIQDEIAILLYRSSRREEARTHWLAALNLLLRMQQHAIYPEAFFTSLETVLIHLGERHLAASFRPEIEAILEPYLAKNGNYRSNELLKAVYTSSATPEEGVSTIISLANSASSPDAVLGDIADAAWLDTPSRAPVLVRRLQLAKFPVEGSQDYRLNEVRHKLLDLYLTCREDTKAQALLDSIPSTKEPDAAFSEARVVLAARAHRLDALLSGYRASPDTASSDAVLTSAADTLDRPATNDSASLPQPDHVSARALREFVFEHKQLEHTLLPTDFLALAQSRLDTQDLPGALTLLRRLTLEAPPALGRAAFGSMPDPYANTDSAAALLEVNKHPGDAVPFLDSLVQLTPWDAAYRLRLAQAQQASGAAGKALPNFLAVARDPSAPYNLRVQAASALAAAHAPATADLGNPNLGSTELTLIAHPATPDAARQPYFAAARLAASRAPGTSAAQRDTLLREAIAINPAVSSDTLLNLLLLQPASSNPSATLAILKSVNAFPTANHPGSNTAADDSTADDSAADSTADDAVPDPTTATGDTSSAAGAIPDSTVPAKSLPPSTLDLPTRIRLASQLSQVSQHDGDLEAALGYAQLAVSLDQASPGPDAALIRRRDELRTAVLLARRNALRRPILQAALAQSNPVRPRLTSLAPEDTP